MAPDFDLIVIGGSYAGMAGALQVARARRRVLVIDAGKRRNRFAASSHGLLGQDGKSPSLTASEAKAQLLAYPNLQWLDASVSDARQQGDGFQVNCESGERFAAKRLLLATGVSDTLPAIEGLQELWGKSVFHCPYCHGYELNQGSIGVIATGPASFHQALMIPDWGPTSFLTNQCFTPDEAQLQQLAARGVVIESSGVVSVSAGTGADAAGVEVQLADGRRVAFAGLFVASLTYPASTLAWDLGCELAESPMGFYVKTNELKQTSVTGIYACGDLARPAGSVTFAIGDGALAGFAVHRSLMFEGLE